MGIQSDIGLNEVYTLLEEGNIAQARARLTSILEYNLDNKEVSFAIWCCSFWFDTFRQLENLTPYDAGETLVAQWKLFIPALKHEGRTLYDGALYAVQTGVFNKAFQNYSQLDEEADSAQKAEIRRKEGLCLKKLGKQGEALAYLKEANELLPNQPEILAEIADCYALCGEEKIAKLLFREAFFIDAEKVDLDFLDSELICVLIRQVEERGLSGSVLQQWIPVYGVLYGVLNIKRELRSQEFGKLRQDIYACENELKNPSNDAKTLTPKLINMYFWLIDHYVQSGDDSPKINDVLLKIKLLDRNVYDLYVK